MDLQKKKSSKQTRAKERYLFGARPKVEITYKQFLELRRFGLNQPDRFLQFQFMGFAANQYRLMAHFKAYLEELKVSFYHLHDLGNVRAFPVYRYTFVSRCIREELPTLDLY